MLDECSLPNGPRLRENAGIAEKGRIAMRTRSFIGAGLLIVLLTNSQAQQEQRFVLLPPGESNSLAEEFPRKGPDRIDGSWQPKIAQIKALEANLSHVSDLTSNYEPNGETVEHPDRFFRQYVAVVRGGQLLIYINALCDVHNRPEWRNHLVPVFTGGNCFWQAWYDPATGSFSELSVNGGRS
jgi:hypothetical protein